MPLFAVPAVTPRCCHQVDVMDGVISPDNTGGVKYFEGA